MGNYIKQNLMQPTPSVANQEKMRFTALLQRERTVLFNTKSSTQ